MAKKSKDTSSAVRVLFASRGLLYMSVDDGFALPEDWNVMLTTARKWYIETRKSQAKYQIPVELPPGIYQIFKEKLTTEDGQKYVNTDFGLAKVVEDWKTERILRMSSKSEVLFRVPGGYRVYYTLKGNMLDQFFEINSPVDKAYVILSTASEEQYETRVFYDKSMEREAPEDEWYREYDTNGRKLSVLGNLEGLKNGIHIRNKSLQVTRRDINFISLRYSYSYDWEPADYVIEVKTDEGEELPAGKVYVFSDTDGKNIPIGFANMWDIREEGTISLSKSWQIYRSWTLTKSTKAGERMYINGVLNLRGNGLTKVEIYAKGLENLTVSDGTIVKLGADYSEIELSVSKTTKVHISFDYLI